VTRGGKEKLDDRVDRLFAGIIINEAINRGASRQELIDLAVRHKRMDVVKHLVDEIPQREPDHRDHEPDDG